MGSELLGLPLREGARMADDIEAAAFADLYAAAPPPLRGRLGLGIERIADATLLLAPGLPSAMFNRAIGLGMQADASPGAVDAIAARYRAAGVASWWLHWNPQARPAGFPEVLQAAGFALARRGAWAKMLRGPDPPPRVPTSLDIGPAADAEVEALASTIALVFEMPAFMAEWFAALHRRPGWRFYAARAAGRIVGGGCTFSRGGVAWLGLGSVLPEHRRRGGQGALMAMRIGDAIRDGARHIVTETGEPIADEPNPSLANMARCGFERVASRANWAAPS
jgi:hypothetical protein